MALVTNIRYGGVETSLIIPAVVVFVRDVVGFPQVEGNIITVQKNCLIINCCYQLLLESNHCPKELLGWKIKIAKNLLKNSRSQSAIQVLVGKISLQNRVVNQFPPST